MYDTCRKAYKTKQRDVVFVIYSEVKSRRPMKPAKGSHLTKINNVESKLSAIYFSEGRRFASSFEAISKQLCRKDRVNILSNVQGYINGVLKQDETNDSRSWHYIKSGSVSYAIK